MVLKLRGGRLNAAALASKNKGFFIKRGRGLEFVRSGAMFKRKLDDAAVETARIISISPDPSGIPHVRYQAAVERPFQGRVETGPRTLNLASFNARFSERA
jgi:hypothetical protein